MHIHTSPTALLLAPSNVPIVPLRSPWPQLRAVTVRSIFPMSLRYPVTGEEQSRITIKPERILELHSERGEVGGLSLTLIGLTEHIAFPLATTLLHSSSQIKHIGHVRWSLLPLSTSALWGPPTLSCNLKPLDHLKSMNQPSTSRCLPFLISTTASLPPPPTRLLKLLSFHSPLQRPLESHHSLIK